VSTRSLARWLLTVVAQVVDYVAPTGTRGCFENGNRVYYNTCVTRPTKPNHAPICKNITVAKAKAGWGSMLDIGHADGTYAHVHKAPKELPQLSRAPAPSPARAAGAVPPLLDPTQWHLRRRCIQRYVNKTFGYDYVPEFLVPGCNYEAFWDFDSWAGR
jgi:hypothetical protein